MTLKSTGVYRCEISAEEPDFKTVQGEGKLEVVCKYFENELSESSYFYKNLESRHKFKKNIYKGVQIDFFCSV